MDLLDRINALTDDQLRMVAERDDASGVLAAYRLAELRGLPYPDREAAILGDGYVIVAQAGQIQKLPIESVEKIIRDEDGEYCVYSHDGSRSFGCYPTMEDAERRLRQIHVFRAVIREGSFVSWNSSGGRARGQVEHVMREGVLGVPDSEFSINATEDDPAVLIHDPDDVALNPRQRMMYEKFEWIADTFGAFDGGVGADGAHYITAADNVFNDQGLNCANCVFYKGGGGCEILNMPVEPEGVCKLWIIPERNVTESAKATVKQISSDGRFLRKEAYQRFTLGPLYVPDFMDAHGEWTDSTELQQAVWEWVKAGDRTIYLQHDRDVRAGEWVEVMTMPQPWTVQMLNGNGESIGEITYPAGTVFLGVIWDEGPWQQILNGELRGYSIGGFSDRVLADLPEEAARDGIELSQEPSLAKSIADAVALAMQQTQPVVNVVMPEAGKARVVRRIERDEHGNIARIIEEDE